jgi:hypothetical protein
MRGRQKEIGLVFPTRGWKPSARMVKTPIAIAATATVGLRSRNRRGAIGLQPDLDTLQRLTSFREDRRRPVEKRQDQLGLFQTGGTQWVTT